MKQIKHSDIHCDLLIPMPEEVPAGKRRPKDTNARFSLIFSIKLRGVTDKRLLKAKDPAERIPKDTVRLEFSMPGNLASRAEDGSIKWDFRKVWGNVSAARANKAFVAFITHLLENDIWVQKFCTRQMKLPDEDYGKKFTTKSPSPEAPSVSQEQASSPAEPCTP